MLFFALATFVARVSVLVNAHPQERGARSDRSIASESGRDDRRTLAGRSFDENVAYPESDPSCGVAVILVGGVSPGVIRLNRPKRRARDERGYA